MPADRFDHAAEPVRAVSRFVVLQSLALHALSLVLLLAAMPAHAAGGQSPRERTNINRDWAFTLGHASDTSRDFNYATTPFFFAKAGSGDGPASPKYDDRAWRRLDLPHDWAVELPFDARADSNHGSRAIGRLFPENSVGWYRKHLDLGGHKEGQRIVVEFDGVYRDSEAWFNGHYLGNEKSGYSSFHYDLTDYVNWQGPNVLVVRVDATREEGWFYEGAGIYRNVWLTRTDPLHVGHWGTFVSSAVDSGHAVVTARTTLVNEGDQAREFRIEESIVGPDGQVVAGTSTGLALAARAESGHESSLRVDAPRLWSLEDPALYRMVTILREGDRIVDRYETPFGIRTVRWDANTGFWLNGKNIKLKGANNHQDHAGVGTAVPESLLEFRLRRLKDMGANAYRTSHHPPAPELLHLADRMGLLVIDEHRMMGTSPEIKDQLTRLIERDRNHPSVIAWSIGNEEWVIEGKELGARLTSRMQDHVRDLDPTRNVTVAIAGGAQHGSSTVIEVLGFNYRAQHDVDAYHANFPDTPAMMSEEGSTFATRGIYVADRDRVHLPAYDAPQRPTNSSSIEQGWTAVAERPWMSGMFVWTGFDYRGETTPFGWPAISSQFGMLDTTGVFKDSAYYLKSWWTDPPMVHLLPHWNWPERMGETIDVVAYSNAEEVELSLNGRSLGRKPIPRYSHARWNVSYEPGTLVATGYRNGKPVAVDKVETTGEADRVQLAADRSSINADGADTTVIWVKAADARGRVAPRADNLVGFSISGPGRIIGVGNGDPGSHEADRYVDHVSVLPTIDWEISPWAEGTALDPASQAWRDPFRWYPAGSEPPVPASFVARGRFLAPERGDREATLYLIALDKAQTVHVNGVDVSASLTVSDRGSEIALPHGVIREGENWITITAPSSSAMHQRMMEAGAKNVGSVGLLSTADPWQRRVFNGYAQVIIQSTGGAGDIVVRATSDGLESAKAVIRANYRPAGTRTKPVAPP